MILSVNSMSAIIDFEQQKLRVAVNRKRDRSRAAIKRTQQDGTEPTAAAILVFPAAATVTAAAK